MSNSSHSVKQNTLLIAALGIVFGDIGTSPIYTFKECFIGAGIETSVENIFGIASIAFWLMILVVTLKYVVFVLQADNKGEGGILALYGSLIEHVKKGNGTKIVTILGLIGAALFWGDSVITPAISVLSAIEGLTVIDPRLKKWVIPVTVGILLSLFLYQKNGTGKIGTLFGPIMLLWFSLLGILGVIHILDQPHVLNALNPMYAFKFLYTHPARTFTVMGYCILVVTGVEALYADMGHFGKRIIRISWLTFVFPCLTLNYLGQAAALIKNPANIEHLFFSLVPEGLLIPFVVLATIATIIASQAVISGVFSLALQAIQLGLLPPFSVVYTSEDHMGRIYVPLVNYIMLAHVVFIVMTFQSSSNLAGAYGLAVSAIMVITTTLILWASHSIWNWHPIKTILLGLVLVPVDSVLFLSNIRKLDGGASLAVFAGMILLFVMLSWRHGESIKKHKTEHSSTTTEKFAEALSSSELVKTKGIGIYLTPYPDHMPYTFFHAVEQIMAVPKEAYGMSILFHSQPHIAAENRIELKKYSKNFTHITAHYGYMQNVRMADIIRSCNNLELDISSDDVTFYVARSIPIVKAQNILELLLEACYVFFARNVKSFVRRIKIHDDRVIQIGMRVILE